MISRACGNPDKSSSFAGTSLSFTASLIVLYNLLFSLGISFESTF